MLLSPFTGISLTTSQSCGHVGAGGISWSAADAVPLTSPPPPPPPPPVTARRWRSNGPYPAPDCPGSRSKGPRASSGRWTPANGSRAGPLTILDRPPPDTPPAPLRIAACVGHFVLYTPSPPAVNFICLQPAPTDTLFYIPSPGQFVLHSRGERRESRCVVGRPSRRY